MKKLFIFITALLAVLALTACGSNKTQSAAPAAATTSAAQADASTNSAQRVRMVINGQDEVLISIDPTPYGRDFLALLPLELTLKDYNGTEKISDLPRRLVSSLRPGPLPITPPGATWRFFTATTVTPITCCAWALSKADWRKCSPKAVTFTSGWNG